MQHGNIRTQAQHQTNLMERANQLAQNVLGAEAAKRLSDGKILAFYEEHVLVENSFLLARLHARNHAGSYAAPIAVVA